MKLKFAFLLLSTSLLFTNCNMVSQEEAITFNDSIIAEQEKIIAAVEAFNEEESYELEVSLELCKAISKQCDESIKVLNRLIDIEGGEAMKGSALTYFKFYKHVSENEYIEYSKLISEEDYSDEEYNRAIEIEETIQSKTSDLEDRIIADQTILAKKYNFNLE